MKLFKLAAFICVAALCAAGCNAPTDTNQAATTNAQPAPSVAAPAATPVDQLAEARRLYAQTCTRCHGEQGGGGKFDLDGETLKAPSLIAGHALKHDDAKLAQQIADGGEGMPAFKKRLSPEQIAGLVRFIRQELQTAAPAASK